MMQAPIPTPDAILRAFVMAHVDPVSARSFRAATARDVRRALGETREMPLLVTAMLAELARFLRADDAWRCDVSAVVIGELVAGKRSTPADRRAMRSSPVDGAWWHPNSRPNLETLTFEFGTGREDFSDIDTSDPSLGQRVTMCTWWPLDGTHYEPMMLIGALHSRGLKPLLRVLGTTSVFRGGEEHGGAATAVWTVMRWLACRIMVTTGRNPAEALGLALHRATLLCEHHRFRAAPLLAELGERVKDIEIE